MTQASLAGHKNHAHRPTAADLLRIVAGAAGEVAMGQAKIGGGLSDRGHHHSVSRGGINAELGVHRNRATGFSTDAFHLLHQLLHQLIENDWIHIPEVNGQGDSARDNIGGIGPDLQPTHRRHRISWMTRSHGLNGKNKARSRHKGILSKPHRGGAGVVGLALHIDAEPTLTNNALHNTDGIAALLKNATLLNMQLQKSGIGLIGAASRGQGGPMAADARQVVLNRLTVAGGITLRVIGGRARQALATHHGRLLVGKGDQLDAVPQAQALVLKRAAGFQTGQHPEGPIKTSTGGNRVEVRPGHQGRAVGIEAFQASDQVASCINTHLHAELLHPVGQQVSALHILRREPASTDASIGLGSNAGQLLNRRNQTLTDWSRRNLGWFDLRFRSDRRSRDERWQCRYLQFKRSNTFSRTG